MEDIHRLMRDVPPLTYALMVGIPLVMVIAAVGVGWYAQAAGSQPGDESDAGRGQSHALGAGVTVAVVPLGFAIVMLWGRFG
jgi:hypothetical protein